MKTPFNQTKIPFALLLFILLFSGHVKGQLSNEFALSAGPTFVPQSLTDPFKDGATFMAKNGRGVQLDYKLMNKSVGIQLAITYLINNYDESYAKDISQATSYDGDTWYAISAMIKFVARAKAMKKKLFIDFSFGTGLLQGNFSQQSYTFVNETIQSRYIYSPEKNASGMAFTAGIRASYAIKDYFRVFANYDYIYSAQNYSVVYQTIDSSGINSITESTRIKRNYSTLFFGILFPF